MVSTVKAQSRLRPVIHQASGTGLVLLVPGKRGPQGEPNPPFFQAGLQQGRLENEEAKDYRKTEGNSIKDPDVFPPASKDLQSRCKSLCKFPPTGF